ncbi:sodium- and chloride-dependent glycine transporter 2-like [Tachypleus tridentatus]|uniref:sodium- and chloride-dependent glycine transporter 2-like n=1 Tax=Tachypleus tridentatus TaxID=6853 RepID=UPI003FD3DA25
MADDEREEYSEEEEEEEEEEVKSTSQQKITEEAPKVSEAELAMEEKTRKKKEEEQAMWQEYLEQRQLQRQKEEEELRKLKERQARRKTLRAEEEAKMMEMKRRQEEMRQKEAVSDMNITGLYYLNNKILYLYLACYSYQDADECAQRNGTYYNKTCVDYETSVSLNLSTIVKNMEKKTPADEYFLHYVLDISRGIEDTGEVKWYLVLCLLLAWIIVFGCLFKGVQTSGKVVYFTALFPYLVLVIMFFRGVTLPGAKEGILWYITPDWSRLAKAQVWGDAAVQIFFALSPAWGGLITLSSYNPFYNNCYKDALIVSISNIMTSIFAGFVIFSVIGYLAHELNVHVEHVVDQGAGLAFIVYPEVVARLPISPLWAFLLFIMLLTLGLDSQFALLECVTTGILDCFPVLRGKKTIVVLIVSTFGFCGGIIFTTRSGMYWLELFDKYAANFSVLLIAIFECLLISWNYGTERFLDDIEKMIGPRSRAWSFFWGTMWKYFTPAALLVIHLIFNWIEYEPLKSGDYVFPGWANAIGWIIAFQSLVVIIGVLIWKLISLSKGTVKERFMFLLSPRDDWGPVIATKLTSDGVEENGVNGRVVRGSSVDNSHFNVTYTFESSI